MEIGLEKISFSFSEELIIKNLNLTLDEGKVTVILGPSGCGKTTLLNLISGLMPLQVGRISLDKTANISYLFQEPRLLPWMTTEENILFVLDSLPLNEKISRCKHYLEIMGLVSFKNYLPKKLSGGMEQRVSIARAFAYPSRIIVMDEPFKGLDLGLKLNLIKLFSKAWREENRTVIMVTHDIYEAALLGDKIVVMTPSPMEIAREIENPVPLNKRRPSEKKTLELEQLLYSLLT